MRQFEKNAIPSSIERDLSNTSHQCRDIHLSERLNALCLFAKFCHFSVVELHSNVCPLTFLRDLRERSDPEGESFGENNNCSNCKLLFAQFLEFILQRTENILQQEHPFEDSAIWVKNDIADRFGGMIQNASLQCRDMISRQ